MQTPEDFEETANSIDNTSIIPVAEPVCATTSPKADESDVTHISKCDNALAIKCSKDLVDKKDESYSETPKNTADSKVADILVVDNNKTFNDRSTPKVECKATLYTEKSADSNETVTKNNAKVEPNNDSKFSGDFETEGKNIEKHAPNLTIEDNAELLKNKDIDLHKSKNVPKIKSDEKFSLEAGENQTIPDKVLNENVNDEATGDHTENKKDKPIVDGKQCINDLHKSLKSPVVQSCNQPENNFPEGLADVIMSDINAAENNVDDGNKSKEISEIKTEAKHSKKLANSDTTVAKAKNNEKDNMSDKYSTNTMTACKTAVGNQIDDVNTPLKLYEDLDKNTDKDPSNKESLKYNDDIQNADQIAKNKDIKVKSAEICFEKPAGISDESVASSNEIHQNDHDFAVDVDNDFDDNTTDINLMDSTLDEMFETSHDNKDGKPTIKKYSKVLAVTGVPLNIIPSELRNTFKEYLPVRPSYVLRGDLQNPTCRILFNNHEECEIALKYLRTHQIFPQGPIEVEYATAETEAKTRLYSEQNSTSYLMVNYKSTKIIALINIKPTIPITYIKLVIKQHTDFAENFFIHREKKNKSLTTKIYFRNDEDCYRMYNKLKDFKKLGELVIVKVESKPPCIKPQLHGKPAKCIQVVGFPSTWSVAQIKEIIKSHCDYNGAFWIQPSGGNDMSKFVITLQSKEEACTLMEKMEWFTINGRKIALTFCTGLIQKSNKRSYSENGSQEGDSEMSAVKKLKPAEYSGPSPSPVKETPRTSNYQNIQKLNASNLFKKSKVPGKPLNMYHETFGISLAYLREIGIVSLPLVQRVCVSNVSRFVTQDHEEDLRKVFSLAGHVTNIEVKNHAMREKDWTCLNVDYSHPVEAVQALALFDKQILCGCEMEVKMDKQKRSTFLPPGLESIGLGFGPEGRPLPTIEQYITQQPLKIAFQNLGMNVTLDFDNCNFFDSRQITKSIEMKQPHSSSGAAVTTSQVQNSDPSAALQAQLITMMQNMQNMLKTIPNLQNNQTTGQAAPQPTLGQSNALSYANLPPPVPTAPSTSSNLGQNVQTPSFSPNVQADSPFHPSVVQNATNMAYGSNLAQNMQLHAGQPYYVQSQASITPDQPYYAQNQNPYNASVVPPQPIGRPPQEPPKYFGDTQSYKPVSDAKEWNTIGQPVTYNQQKKEYSQVPPPKTREPPKSCHEFLVFSCLPPSVTPEALSTKIREVGELVFCEAAGPGRALVRFKHERDADRCIRLFDNSKVDGRVINVKRM